MLRHVLSHEDLDLLTELRAHPHRRRRPERSMALGSRVADLVAALVGSWRFIVVQSVLLVMWIVLNATGWIEGFGMKPWDPYPFILLNLMLSFQAAYTAPIIMMSQNRQNEIDRRKASEDYHINIKAELEIEALHQKIDLLREQEIARLTQIIQELSVKLEKASPS